MTDSSARRSLAPAILAGSSWGLAVGFGLAAVQFLGCGAICIPDLLATTGLAVGGGLATIGPAVFLMRRRPPPGVIRSIA